MTVNLKDLNRLPAPTWSWLGVNGETFETELPGFAPWPYAAPQALPAGVKVSGILKDEIVFLEGDIDTSAGVQTRDFVKQHRNGGLFIQAQAGAQIADPLVFDYTLTAAQPALADENTIIAEAGSRLTVVFRYHSEQDVHGFHAGLTRVYAKKGARVTLVQVQTLGGKCPHFENVGGSIFEDAKVELIQAEIGASQTFSGAAFKLIGERGGLDIGSIYLGDGARKIDLNYVAEHRGKNSRTDIAARGAMLGESRKTFRGTIDFKRGAAGAKGHEEEYAVLLSPKVVARSAPLILCEEEDVDGQHAASTGRIDENRLFYLMSRGLSEAQARKLIIEAQFAPIIARIPVASIRDSLQAHVTERLNESDDK